MTHPDAGAVWVVPFPFPAFLGLLPLSLRPDLFRFVLGSGTGFCRISFCNSFSPRTGSSLTLIRSSLSNRRAFCWALALDPIRLPFCMRIRHLM